MNTLENTAREEIKERRVIGTITSSKPIDWYGRELTIVYVFRKNSKNKRERIPVILRDKYHIPKGTRVSMVYEPLLSGFNVSKSYTNLDAF
jgi:hypothetical protein